MENLLEPTPGQFPHRFTQDDRFQFRVKVQPVAGMLEFTVRTIDTRLSAMAAQRQWMGFPKRIGPSQTTDTADNVRRSHERAKGRIRLLCLELRVDRMLTFSIRKVGERILSRDEFLKVWEIFRRRMEKNDKSFSYVAVPELQKNGMFHMHVGIHGYANIDTVRTAWQKALNKFLGRALTLLQGEDSPGTVNMKWSHRYGDTATSAQRIASYISKYISKDHTSDFNRKSYFHTTDVKIAPARAMWLRAETMEEALREVVGMYDLIGEEGMPLFGNIWRRDRYFSKFSMQTTSMRPPPF